MHQVVVSLLSGKVIPGVPYEMNLEEVQETIQRFLQAEGQGSLVVDCGSSGWKCIPTRSIDFVSIVPVPEESKA